MKKLFLLFSAIALLTGCANEELTTVTEQPANNKMAVSVEKSPILDGDGTSAFRTSVDMTPTIAYLKWNTGDMIGIRKINSGPVFAGAAQNHQFEYTGSGDDLIPSGTFTKVSATTFSAGDHIAYYPYSTDALVGGNMQFNLPCQIQDGNASYSNFGSCDFMYSDVLTLTKTQIGDTFDKTETPITFNHAMAFLQFTLTDLTPGDILYQIEVTSSSIYSFKRSFEIAADGSVSYTNPTPSMVLFPREGGVNGYTIQSDGAYSGWLLVSPDIPPSTPLNLFIRTNKGCFQLTSVNIPSGTKAGYRNNISRSLTGISSITDRWDGVLPYSIPYIDGNNITIRTPYELAWVAGVCNKTITGVEMGGVTNSNFDGYIITVGNDINLSQPDWTPIGNAQGKAFAGTFDGAKHVISSFRITNPISNAGLFGFTSTSANIKNILASSASIEGGPNVGVIVAQNAGRVENCTATNCTVKGSKGNNTGGIVGTNTGVVVGCTTSYNSGEISGTANIGGTIGKNDGVIENCIVRQTNGGSQKIAGSGAYVGGVVGINTGTILACRNSVSVEGWNYVGGIVGSSTTGTMAVCYNEATSLTGNVNNAYVGGIVGQIQKGYIISCVSNFIPSNPTSNLMDTYTDGIIAGYVEGHGMSTCLAAFLGYPDGVNPWRLLGMGSNNYQMVYKVSDPNFSATWLNNVNYLPKFAVSIDGGYWGWAGTYGVSAGLSFKKF